MEAIATATGQTPSAIRSTCQHEPVFDRKIEELAVYSLTNEEADPEQGQHHPDLDGNIAGREPSPKGLE